jgi:hypothetical protein
MQPFCESHKDNLAKQHASHHNKKYTQDIKLEASGDKEAIEVYLSIKLNIHQNRCVMIVCFTLKK